MHYACKFTPQIMQDTALLVLFICLAAIIRLQSFVPQHAIRVGDPIAMLTGLF